MKATKFIAKNINFWGRKQMSGKLKKQQTTCMRVSPFNPDCFPVDFFLISYEYISLHVCNLGNNERVYLCPGSKVNVSDSEVFP